MGRARIHGDVPHRCIRPSLRHDDPGSPSRMAVSIRPCGASMARAATGIMADLISPRTVDRDSRIDVNRSAQEELDTNCGRNGHQLRKSTAAEIIGQPIVLGPMLRGGRVHDHSAYGIAGLSGNGRRRYSLRCIRVIGCLCAATNFLGCRRHELSSGTVKGRHRLCLGSAPMYGVK